MLPIELLSFLSLVAMSVLAACCESDKNRRLLLDVSTALLIIYAFVVRISGPDQDMYVYLARLDLTGESFSYFLQEPLYWYPLYAINQVAHFLGIAPIYCFFLVDILIVFVVRYVVQVIGLPVYILCLFFVFFPSFFGIQNIYREFVGTVLLLLAVVIGKDEDGMKRGVVVWVLAGLVHNAMFMYGGLLFLRYEAGWRRLVLALCFFGVGVLGLVIYSALKSPSSSGFALAPVYIALETLFLAVAIDLSRWSISRYILFTWPVIAYVTGLTVVGYFLVGSSQTERLGMIALTLVFLGAAEVVERFDRRVVSLRLVYVAAAAAPTLLFPASRMLLFTAMNGAAY